MRRVVPYHGPRVVGRGLRVWQAVTTAMPTAGQIASIIMNAADTVLIRRVFCAVIAIKISTFNQLSKVLLDLKLS
jgi:hypothetical protein